MVYNVKATLNEMLLGNLKSFELTSFHLFWQKN